MPACERQQSQFCALNPTFAYRPVLGAEIGKAAGLHLAIESRRPSNRLGSGFADCERRIVGLSGHENEIPQRSASSLKGDISRLGLPCALIAGTSRTTKNAGHQAVLVALIAQSSPATLRPFPAIGIRTLHVDGVDELAGPAGRPGPAPSSIVEPARAFGAVMLGIGENVATRRFYDLAGVVGPL